MEMIWQLLKQANIWTQQEAYIKKKILTVDI